MKNLVISFFVLVGIVAATVFLMSISYNNSEATKMNTFIGKKKQVENVHDKMWKILKQKAGVSEQYKETFESVYPQIIGSRYGQNGDGSLMKFVQEANPTFDLSLLKDLSTSIEALRTEFANKQDEAIAIQTDYNTFIAHAPARWFLSPGVKPLDYDVVSSGTTKQAMETRMDDDTELFSKPAPQAPAPQAPAAPQAPQAPAVLQETEAQELQRLRRESNRARAEKAAERMIITPPMPQLPAPQVHK